MLPIHLRYTLYSLVIVAPGLAQTTTPQPFQWNISADSYVLQNANDPASGVNGVRAFDTKADALRLGGVNLDLDYKVDRWGAHVTAGYGDRYAAIAIADPLKGANSYLSQYFVSYKPVKNNGLQLDFGKFYTSVGAEVVDPQANFNYSRSLLFTIGEPLDHFGFRATVPITNTFTAGFQVLQGWNDVIPVNRGETFGFTTALTKAKWAWSQTILVGPERPNTTDGQRQLVDEVITVNPNSKMQAYVELVYGRDKRPGTGTGADAWYGAAAAGRWNATKRLSFSPRFEYMVDQSGFMSGMAQHLHEWTGTAEYQLHSLLRTRLEYRQDLSNQPYFERGKDAYSRSQNTLTLALLMSLKGER